MEYQKLTDLLDDTTNQLPKCTADYNDMMKIILMIIKITLKVNDKVNFCD